mmetsp:Transcript_8562/g.9804  ORF Transcript_8562/g.9804 Transcript_8562/m.9804 type:complete len:383 (+) Transcript_8562:231-1379(+)|eukprot:CAMPEP_0184025946 /NCGR_PEP_ID=MMETSP0954-20121128/13174_1 /TAXON_ID=627963 /ORGANISM="Aplanochytrium sp, Strain PBS07" /LENGTH=382 /DNA_ID=CAMNT_0026309949 /DNA_START=191 /DNA_END=1339 /DNA_ORIENTATION=-
MNYSKGIDSRESLPEESKEVSTADRLRSLEKITKAKAKDGSKRSARKIVEMATKFYPEEGTVDSEKLRKVLTPSQVAMLYETLQMSGNSSDLSTESEWIENIYKWQRSNGSRQKSMPGTILSSEGLILSHSFAGGFSSYSSDAFMVNNMYLNHDSVAFPSKPSSEVVRKKVWDSLATRIQAAWRGYASRKILLQQFSQSESKRLNDDDEMKGLPMIQDNMIHSRSRKAMPNKSSFGTKNLVLSIDDETVIYCFYNMVQQFGQGKRFTLRRMLRFIEIESVRRSRTQVSTRMADLMYQSKRLILSFQSTRINIDRKLHKEEFTDLLKFGFLAKFETTAKSYLPLDVRKNISDIAQMLLPSGNGRKQQASLAEGIVGAYNWQDS